MSIIRPLFDNLKGANHDFASLDRLSEFMASDKNSNLNPSLIPSGYTYLLQLIAHDVSFTSGIDDQFPWEIGEPVPTISNVRNPTLDLDTIYGHTINGSLNIRDGRSKLKLGSTTPGLVSKSLPNDLPRVAKTASIVDRRNDNNLVVAQLQVAFMKFHNAVVQSLALPDTDESFEYAKTIVIKHYQFVVLYDLLERIVSRNLIESILRDGPKLLNFDGDPFVSQEFASAAFRFGHSMIRNTYNWNAEFRLNRAPSVGDLRRLTGNGCQMGLRNCLDGATQLPTEWLINWKWFFDIDRSSINEPQFFNYARPANTLISSWLGALGGGTSYYRDRSLIAMDLFRGWAVALPSGNQFADEYAKRVSLSSAPSEAFLIGLLPSTLAHLAANPPLWFYFLAEEKPHSQALGEMGGRLVAETLICMIINSEPSIFDDMEDFRNSGEFLGANGKFDMGDLLKFTDRQLGNLIDPVGNNT